MQVHACVLVSACVCACCPWIVSKHIHNAHHGLAALTLPPAGCNADKLPVEAPGSSPVLLGPCSAHMHATPWHGSRTVAMLRTGST